MEIEIETEGIQRSNKKATNQSLNLVPMYLHRGYSFIKYSE